MGLTFTELDRDFEPWKYLVDGSISLIYNHIYDHIYDHNISILYVAVSLAIHTVKLLLAFIKFTPL